MDKKTKVTLSMSATILQTAKELAQDLGLSLSALVTMLINEKAGK